jgi:hypothetical protein
MTYCCEALKAQVHHRCADHPNPIDCPDALIVEAHAGAEFGIRVHDGGSSFVRIHHCPWCGADLSQQNETVTSEPSSTSGPEEARVFLLWHVHRHDDGYEDEKLIGVYSTEQGAVAAQERVAGQPGFRDQPHGFEISPRRVDRDDWVEGFGAGR